MVGFSDHHGSAQPRRRGVRHNRQDIQHIGSQPRHPPFQCLQPRTRFISNADNAIDSFISASSASEIPIDRIHLVSTGENRGQPLRSVTTETPTRTADQPGQLCSCSGCNPGKYPDTQRMVFAARPGSRDIAHDRHSCIAVWWSEPPRR
jgi:hypothetical protein